MTVYILRRLLLAVPTLLGMTIVVFTVMASSPGGLSAQSLVEGQNLEPEVKKALEDYYNQRYGLDDPAPLQFLRWLNNVSPIGFTQDESGSWTGFSLFKGSDLGTSFRYGRPVGELIAERVPITLLLNVLSLPLIYGIAIAIGLRAATQRRESFDSVSGVVMLALWSVPTMLAGVLMIGFFASNAYWPWFPTAGISDREALDMTFLPWWAEPGDWWSLVLVAISVAVSGLWAALREQAALRMWLFGLAGLGLSVWMVDSVQTDLPWWIDVGVTLSLTGLLVAIAGMQYAALRVFLLGGLAATVGLALGAQLGSGDFSRGFLLDRLWHLALPVLAMSYGGFAFLAKLTRSSVLEQLNSQYVVTARAKGVDEDTVLWRHVFRNALIPLITVSSSLLPGLLAGSIIIESIFSIDGMGKLAVEAVQARDRELVLSITLISGVLTLLGYLLSDLLYAWADPRVSYD